MAAYLGKVRCFFVQKYIFRFAFEKVLCIIDLQI